MIDIYIVNKQSQNEGGNIPARFYTNYVLIVTLLKFQELSDKNLFLKGY